VTPTGSAARPRRVTLCISKPPVRRDAGVGAILAHEVSIRVRRSQPFSMRQKCNVTRRTSAHDRKLSRVSHPRHEGP